MFLPGWRNRISRKTSIPPLGKVEQISTFSKSRHLEALGSSPRSGFSKSGKGNFSEWLRVD